MNLAGIWSRQDYIAQHWQGGFTLGYAVWVNAVPGAILLAALARLAAEFPDFAAIADSRAVTSLFLGATTAIFVVFGTWLLTGVWRSASRHVERGGQAHWALLGRILVLLGAALLARDLLLTSGRLVGFIGSSAP